MNTVLFIITKSNFGGAQRYVFDLATRLPRDRFEPVVAFGPAQGSAVPGALRERLADAGIRTIFVPELGRDIGMADIRAIRALVKLLRTERPDVVHLNSSKAGLLGAFAARIWIPLTPHASRLSPSLRIIFTAHGWPFREARNPLWRIVAWLGSVITVIMAHRTICVSEADTQTFDGVPFLKRKLVRIYNGIDLSMPFGSGERIRNSFPAGARITGTIGELTTNKNQAALIEAAHADPSMYVAIVGEGEDRPKLEHMIAAYGLGERVKLFGFVPATEVLKGFDTFSLPSRKEGLPYVLIEARAAGVPIEANRTGGVGEALDLPLETFSLERMVRETMAAYIR